jgi:hypothetical protein
MAVEKQGTLFLFDCPFDEASDEYPSSFEVYELPADARPLLEEPSWEKLPQLGTLIGRVSAEKLEFDPTRRTAIRAAAFDFIEP